MRGGMFYLNNSRQLDDPFLDLTNAERRRAEPGDVLRQQQRDARGSATTSAGPAGRWSGSRSAARTTASTSGEQRTWTIGDTLSWTTVIARAAHGRRIPPQRVQHQPAGRAGDGVREVRQLHDAAARPGDRSRHAVRHHRQAVPLQRLQPVPLRRLAAVAIADAERSACATSSSVCRKKSTAGSATSTSRR